MLTDRTGIQYGILILTILLVILTSCRQQPTPKPRGYFRIDLPEHLYREYRSDCPFEFEYPAYASLRNDLYPGSEPCWFNIEYPQFNGEIHLSYKAVNGNFARLSEDARTLVYKHSIKADAIGEQLFLNPDEHVYGILYDIGGNAASSIQFYLTDSVRHFVRGALYFNSKPNADSLAPVISFCREDIVHLIETFSWK